MALRQEFVDALRAFVKAAKRVRECEEEAVRFVTGKRIYALRRAKREQMLAFDRVADWAIREAEQLIDAHDNPSDSTSLFQYWRLVETDNYNGDYPNETWATPYMFLDEQAARSVANALNDYLLPGGQGNRFVKVVSVPYKLAPGFQP